jgi:hypothetical protein
MDADEGGRNCGRGLLIGVDVENPLNEKTVDLQYLS